MNPSAGFDALPCRPNGGACQPSSGFSPAWRNSGSVTRRRLRARQPVSDNDPMTIRCVGLTALAISVSVFAATAAAAPVPSTTPADTADGLTLVASPTIAGQFSRALAHGIQPSQNSSGGTKVVPSVPFNTASSSLIGVLAPQPALLGRSDNPLTFFVGGEQVAPLTEDQTWDVIAGTALVSGELPFYVVTRAQQRVKVEKQRSIGREAAPMRWVPER